MADKRTIKIFEPNNIEISSDICNINDNLISGILKEENFNRLNNLQNSANIKTKSCLNPKIRISAEGDYLEFISVDTNSIAPFSTIINEKEFFKIIGLTKKGLSSRSGKYQESLYGYYLEAKQEKDAGYISDILDKAVVFSNNLNYVKKLQKNKKFMKEWQRNFGKESPVKIFKNSGSLRKINIVYERTK